MTNFNERTNTLLYKNIPLTLYSRKGWCWLCVRGELETGTDWYILTQSSSDHSSTSFSSWLGLLNHRSLRAEALCLPLALTSTSCPQLTPTATDSSRLCPGYIFVWCPPASAVLPLIYTGASLDWRLGRGSICYNRRCPRRHNKQTNDNKQKRSWVVKLKPDLKQGPLSCFFFKCSDTIGNKICVDQFYMCMKINIFLFFFLLDFRDAIVTSVVNCCTSFLAGFAVFSVLGYMAHVQQKDVGDVSRDGKTLIFLAIFTACLVPSARLSKSNDW